MKKYTKKYITPVEDLQVFNTEEQYRKGLKAAKATAARNKINNQIKSRDFPDLYEGMDIDMDKLGCIMLDVEKIPVAQFVKNAQDDLFIETRYDQDALVGEVKPHVTLLFGLLENGNIWKDKVDKLLEGWKCTEVTIEQVSYFDLGDSYAIIGLVEKTDTILDGHERLTLLPHINTFSEYHPHITLAYIKHDVDPDKWVNALSKRYNGQKVVTKSINYGDLPEKTKTDNSSEAVLATLSPVEATHEHNCEEHALTTNSTLEKAYNALATNEQDQVLLQEADLQRAFARLEADIANKVLEALRRGDVDEAEELISEAEEENFILELAVILAGFYLILFPIYAAQLLFARLAQYGLQGVFAMTDELQEYIRATARNAAESHVGTIISDLSKTYDNAVETQIREALITVVVAKMQEQDSPTLAKLPSNPNQDDVVRAVDAGRFDKEPAYAEARRLVRQGFGQAEIARAITAKYTNITKTRAVTIARHESNRVFNMSQFQADEQFLTEAGLMQRAYKRLRNRANDPCPVCASLIAKTRANPIPFTKNFADLGETLTAAYQKENGKMAVQKVLVNYESIAAGNIHVNCRCEYELVVKNSDGTFMNEVDFRVNNDIDTEDNMFTSLGYNPYRDSDGKFDDGLTIEELKKLVKSDKNKQRVAAAKAELKKRAAQSKDSPMRKNAEMYDNFEDFLAGQPEFYHGTGGGATFGVLSAEAGNILGDGVYIAHEKEVAEKYGKEVETVYVRLRNPYIIQSDMDFAIPSLKSGNEVGNILELDPRDTKKNIERMRTYLEKQGYDSVIVVNVKENQLLDKLFDDNQTVVFSPEDVYRESDLRRIFDEVHGDKKSEKDKPEIPARRTSFTKEEAAEFKKKRLQFRAEQRRYIEIEQREGGLTQSQAEAFRASAQAYSKLLYEYHLPVNKDKVKTGKEAQSTLTPDIIYSIIEDKMKNFDAYMAIEDATSGTFYNADTPIDDIMNGKNNKVSPLEFYNLFNDTRAELRKEFGDTITLYRAEGRQQQKYTTNWATTEEFARNFGANITKKEFPIEQVISANATRTGTYHELVIGMPPAGADDTKQLTFGARAYDAATASNAKYKRLVSQHKADYKEADDSAALFYTGVMGHRYINMALRTLSSDEIAAKTHQVETRDGQTSNYKEVIDGMDSLMAKSKTKVDMTVIRAANIPKAELQMAMDKKKLTDKGYVSTATTLLSYDSSIRDYSRTPRFYSYDKPSTESGLSKAQETYESLPDNEPVKAFFNIKIPKGSNGIMVDALPSAKNKIESESEFILPRNTSLRITGVKMQHADASYYTRVDPVFIIDAELI